MGALHSRRALNCPAVDLQAFEAVCKKLIERMRAPALNCVELSMNELCDITSKVAEKVFLLLIVECIPNQGPSVRFQWKHTRARTSWAYGVICRRGRLLVLLLRNVIPFRCATSARRAHCIPGWHPNVAYLRQDVHAS
jgi:hypothetical protein